MTQIGRLALLTTALVLTVQPAAAQRPPEQGETVRLVVKHPTLRSTESVVGVFDGVGRDSLYLTRAVYSRPLVRRIDVARGTTSYATLGMALGGGLSGVAGALLGASDDHANLQREGRPAWVRGGVIGAGAGVLLGGLIGSLFRRTRWVWVPLDALSHADLDGRWHVGLAWRLP